MATYPKFTAYERNFEIKDFFKNVDYHGGFSMAGSKLYGIGTDDQKASIAIYVNNKVALKTFSNAFILQKEEIISLPAEISIYLESDSIYHPGIEFRFNAKQRQVVLLRKKDGIAGAAFFDPSRCVVSGQLQQFSNHPELPIVLEKIPAYYAQIEQRWQIPEHRFVAKTVDASMSTLDMLHGLAKNSGVEGVARTEAARCAIKDFIGLCQSAILVK